jgi:hypothetical protein
MEAARMSVAGEKPKGGLRVLAVRDRPMGLGGKACTRDNACRSGRPGIGHAHESSDMKDQLTTMMTEAVRRSQAVLAEYMEPGEHNAEVTIARLVGILGHRDVKQAMRLLYPGVESPGIRPEPRRRLKTVS